VSGARGCIVLFGAVMIVLGIAGFVIGSAQAAGFPAIPILIFGCLVVATALVEPVYGKLTTRPRLSEGWRPTGEKFIDPASDKPVEVWFDPATGERRYVDVEGEKKR